MGSGTHSDLALRLAIALGLIVLCVTLGMVAQMLVLRWGNRASSRVQADVIARWRPLLVAVIASDDPVAPPLQPREQGPFLLLWNQMMESLRGESRLRLRRFAGQLGLHEIARRWSRQRDHAACLLGLITLGHLGRGSDWEMLLDRLRDPRTDVSLAAARALMLIDPHHAVPDVIEAMRHRPDWPVSRVAGLLREAGADAACQPMLDQFDTATDDELLRLVPLLAVTNEQEAGRAVLAIVERASDPRLLEAALSEVQGPAARPVALRLAGHPAWTVRAEAAAALGRGGSAQDQPLLVEMLSDREWWVRYQAAQALASLPGLSLGDGLRRLQESLQDRFARDILDQVLAEQALR